MYNLIAVPVAAGAIYPARHARLSPVWSSLAMALSCVFRGCFFKNKYFPFLMSYNSSTSVVCSSLLLRLYNQPRFNDQATDSELATTNEMNHAVKVDSGC